MKLPWSSARAEIVEEGFLSWNATRPKRAAQEERMAAIKSCHYIPPYHWARVYRSDWENTDIAPAGFIRLG